jgi:flagellar basal-body rod protein FlgB
MDSRTSVIPYLEAGLRAAGLQGKAIAQNIANLNTPGYRRVAIEFRKRLAEAAAAGDPGRLDAQLLRPMNTQVRSNGNDVDLDMEVGALIKNGALYKTYMRILAKRYRQLELAVRGQF